MRAETLLERKKIEIKIGAANRAMRLQIIIMRIVMSMFASHIA